MLRKSGVPTGFWQEKAVLTTKDLQKEYQTITAMIDLYCRELHHTDAGELCLPCRELLDYAKARLCKCPFADDKPTCAACPIHCYKPQRRAQMQQVMRYAGPRMLRSHPVLAIRHLLKKFKKPKTKI